MQYVYAAMLLHSAKSEVNEANVEAVLKSAKVEFDAAKVKAMVASLKKTEEEAAAGLGALFG